MEKVDLAVVRNEFAAAVRNILPVTELLGSRSIATSTERSPQSLLRRFYLFPLTHITFPSETQDAGRLVTELYRNVLAAAYRARLTMLTALHGQKGRVDVYVGFMSDRSHDPRIFQKLFEGVFPGSMREVSQKTLDELAEGLEYGGIVSAIPILKIEDERQVFKVSSVVRSMYDESYLLLMISKPVDELVVRDQYRELLEARSTCHERAVRTRVKESGGGEHAQYQKSTGSSSGFGFILTFSDSSTEGRSTGRESHWSESLSSEEQDGLAVEMEKIADSFIERTKKALNVGYWESTITFACETETGSEILGGSLLGELSRPSTDHLPARLHLSRIAKEQIVLLPATDSASKIFPRSLCSYITSEELAMLAAPPAESLPGFDLRRMPLLALS
ncbi:MAG: hypothetical protein FJY85_15460, partial [Deltaproteobacteria bacterium]|nr:hypothetical protein [Deltaproteobacteria bacterium]